MPSTCRISFIYTRMSLAAFKKRHITFVSTPQLFMHCHKGQLFKKCFIVSRVSHSSLSKPILHLAIFKLCIAALFILLITYVVVFLICKSFWIKAFAKWINANVANPIAVLFIVREHVFIKRIFETVNHVIARRGAEKIKYKTSHASFPERVIFNKTSQSNNSNPMEVYCVLFTQDLQACIPGSSDPYIWETTSPSIILPDEFPCQGN